MGTSPSRLTIYSQNVSCDTTSEKLTTLDGMEDMTFSKRFETMIKKIPEKVDVVAFNEIRYKENVILVLKSLDGIGFTATAFANNNSTQTFQNILAVRKGCKWQVVKWKHKWVGYDGQQYTLFDDHCTIDGDPHGRCAGIVQLQHKSSKVEVSVMVSHLSPEGEVKMKQQNALFSFNRRADDNSPPCIIVGDLNRFHDEDEDFQRRLEEHGLKEVPLGRLVVASGSKVVNYNEKEDIGTFVPWKADRVYEMKRAEKLSTSRLDVQLHSNRPDRIEVELAYARATMQREPHSDNPPPGVNRMRHLLDGNMTSDHLAIIGQYVIK